MNYRRFIKVISPWLLLALVMNITRQAIAEVPSYIYMNWNIFLGLLPVLFAWLFEQKVGKGMKTFFFFVWLFFLPNAPYMVTDFIHLRDVGTQAYLWFDGMMLFAYALVGVYAMAFTVDRIGRKALGFGRRNFFLFSSLIALVSSFGIYLGRYIRWNTWDIVTRPVDVAANVFEIIQTQGSQPIFVTTVVFFSSLMVLASYSFQARFKKDAS